METNNETQLVIYQTPNGETQLDVTVRGETIWLTQRQIADLFGTKVPAISKHLKISSHRANWIVMRLFPKWKQS